MQDAGVSAGLLLHRPAEIRHYPAAAQGVWGVKMTAKGVCLGYQLAPAAVDVLGYGAAVGRQFAKNVISAVDVIGGLDGGDGYHRAGSGRNVLGVVVYYAPLQ